MAKKKTRKKRRKKAGPPKQPPAATPSDVPIPTPTPVPPAAQALPAQPTVALPEPVATPGPVSFSAIRQWLRTRAQTLLEASRELAREGLAPNLILPGELVRDIDNVLCSIETYAYGADPEGMGTRKLVGGYTRLAEVTLFWTSHVKEQVVKIERAIEAREAKLDVEVREKIRTEFGASAVKENAVKAGKAADTGRQKLADLAAEWETLKFQLQNILTSLRVEVIVQDSCWTQREMGYKEPGLVGAVGGPSYQG